MNLTIFKLKHAQSFKKIVCRKIQETVFKNMLFLDIVNA